MNGPGDVEREVLSIGPRITVLPVNTDSQGSGSSMVRAGERTATGYGAVEAGALFWQAK